MAATIIGTLYDDNSTWNGGGYRPSLYGTFSSDHIYGLDGNDYLFGFEGNDTLAGGAGADTMYGGTDNDIYYVDTMLDTIIESANQDIYDYVFSSVSTSYKWLPANVELLVLTGTAYYGDGNDGNNYVIGNDSSNALFGYGGNDVLYSYDNNDYLFGGNDNDILGGLAGRDYLSGGTGKDIFVYARVSESPAWGAYDTISDFNWREGDKIDLSVIDADLGLAGDQAFNASQLSWDYSSGVLTAYVYWGDDLQIHLIGASGFAPSLDVIA